MFPRLLPVPRLRLLTLATLALLAALPAPAEAQGRSASKAQAPSRATTDSAADVPKHMMPPAGKCRIWMRGVPAAQQPAPTDCTTALRQAPSNGVLVFGPALRDLSPFDVRRPGAASTSVDESRERRAAESRRDTTGRRTTPTKTQATSTKETRGNGLREMPTTTRAPAVRETPPVRKPEPTPPPKKPEQGRTPL